MRAMWMMERYSLAALAALVFAAMIFGGGCGGSGGASLAATPEKPQVPTGSTGARAVRLNSGHEMPTLGYGTWTISDADAEGLVYHAIKTGYRLIDTARWSTPSLEASYAI